MRSESLLLDRLPSQPPVRWVRGRGLWRWLPGPDDLVARYDRAASSWHALQWASGYLGAFRALAAGLAASGTLRPELRVLDCGVGTGALSLGFARAGVQRLWGLDASSGMLREARRHLRRAGVEPDLRQGDIRQLPYADATFDAVACAHVLEHLADPATALAEMARVLRPGGTL
ncbi:MAG TPA: class I SAM-dependent methyltransferase [Aggregicoccus sp.]|nr:class I SAM-dependent methyltransferase [Aggregicoccus sp.]